MPLLFSFSSTPQNGEFPFIPHDLCPFSTPSPPHRKVVSYLIFTRNHATFLLLPLFTSKEVGFLIFIRNYAPFLLLLLIHYQGGMSWVSSYSPGIMTHSFSFSSNPPPGVEFPFLPHELWPMFCSNYHLHHPGNEFPLLLYM